MWILWQMSSLTLGFFHFPLQQVAPGYIYEINERLDEIPSGLAAPVEIYGISRIFCRNIESINTFRTNFLMKNYLPGRILQDKELPADWAFFASL